MTLSFKNLLHEPLVANFNRAWWRQLGVSLRRASRLYFLSRVGLITIRCSAAKRLFWVGYCR